MFTGIITDIGTIIDINKHTYSIATSYDIEQINIGDSICCSGICLTVVEKGYNNNYFMVELSSETIDKTIAKYWNIGTTINLEQSLKIGDKLGGHILTGHIDDVSSIVSIIEEDNANIYSFSLPKDIGSLIAKKGSISINGVSLTVNYVDHEIFKVNIIPYTKDNTNFKKMNVNDIVNVEVDILARYIARKLEY